MDGAEEDEEWQGFADEASQTVQGEAMEEEVAEGEDSSAGVYSRALCCSELNYMLTLYHSPPKVSSQPHTDAPPVFKPSSADFPNAKVLFRLSSSFISTRSCVAVTPFVGRIESQIICQGR